MNLKFPVLIACLTAFGAHAGTIYKCASADGSTLISNTKVDKSCKAVVSGPDNAVPAPRAKAAATPSPDSFPKVGEQEQKSRDSDRKRILEQELAAEQKNLDAARRDLAEQEAPRAGEDRQRAADRAVPYRERVGQHERNIAAIQKELGGLK